jgi:serine/threonine protein kinase
MELLNGQALEQAIEHHGALAPERVDRIMVQVTGSLQEAHEKGIVHRDLKPANIYLTKRGGEEDYVKVLDFGIAKRGSKADKKEQKLTPAGTMLGTPPYMSPEQFTAELDLRSDIYSLGVMTYEMLTGKLPSPFGGSDPVVEVQAAAQAEVDAPATIRDAGPPVSEDGDAEARPIDAEPATTRDSEPTFEPSRSDGGADPSQHGIETSALRSKKGTLVMAASQPPPKPPMPDLIPPTIRDPSVAGGGRGSRRWLLFGALALVVAGAIASALTWFFYLRDAPKPKPKRPKPPASSAPPPG